MCVCCVLQVHSQVCLISSVSGGTVGAGSIRRCPAVISRRPRRIPASPCAASAASSAARWRADWSCCRNSSTGLRTPESEPTDSLKPHSQACSKGIGHQKMEIQKVIVYSSSSSSKPVWMICSAVLGHH